MIKPSLDETFVVQNKDIPLKFVDNGPNNQYHTLKYDFKPASVNSDEPAQLELDSNGQVTIKAPSVGGSVTTFKGQRRPHKKECLLIIDHRTGEVVLQSLADNITVKATRAMAGGNSTNVPAPTSTQSTAAPSTNSTATNNINTTIINNSNAPINNNININIHNHNNTNNHTSHSSQQTAKDKERDRDEAPTNKQNNNLEGPQLSEESSSSSDSDDDSSSSSSSSASSSSSSSSGSSANDDGFKF